eukprot:TRINITY_DN266_c0_g1_i1.p1 TRINITY_DN266_c0_g1~~TRINITY_DN266_c0_g1_i1.p1  ORF type:complete len:363 (+),score=88.51 TRINITY_DN266_c0_g1_i1:63-1151(+)
MKNQLVGVAYLQKFGPILAKAGKFLDMAGPYLAMLANAAQFVYAWLIAHHVEEYLPIITGAVLLLFGGRYMTLIAAVEAVRISGYDKIVKYLRELWANYKVAVEASRKDDQVDDNNDGIPDVQQISQQELLTRKLKLLLKVIDPERVGDALTGLYACAMAVVAALRIRFAAAIALGAAIGDMLYPRVSRVLTPALEYVIPEDYRKWTQPILKYGCKTIGVTIAWWAERVITAFHSSLRGAELLVSGLLIQAARKNFSFKMDPASKTAGVVAAGVAGVGFYWQVTRTLYKLPFSFRPCSSPSTSPSGSYNVHRRRQGLMNVNKLHVAHFLSRAWWVGKTAIRTKKKKKKKNKKKKKKTKKKKT